MNTQITKPRLNPVNINSNFEITINYYFIFGRLILSKQIIFNTII